MWISNYGKGMSDCYILEVSGSWASQEPLTTRGVPSLHTRTTITLTLLLMSTGQSPVAAPADDILTDATPMWATD